MDTTENVCRLCLGMVGNDFKLIDDNTRKIFDVIQLKIDLSISNEPVMCKNCEENLQLSVDFKSTFMHAEEIVASFTTNIGDRILCLGDIFPSKNENMNAVSDEDYDVCRFCVQHVKRDYCKSLDSVKENIILAKNMSQIYLPELKLMSNKEPVVCVPCLERLEEYLEFIKTCWDVEEKIKVYCSTEGMRSKGQIQLNDVLKYMSEDDNKPILKGVIKMDTDSIKTEKIEQIDVKHEYSMKLEQDEVDIKAEIADESQRLDSFEGKGSPIVSKIKIQEGPTYKCERCSYNTKVKRYLQQHMKSHRDLLEVDVYECDKCTFKTRYKCSLKAHMLTHDLSEQAVYKCEECAYKTKYKNCIQVHTLKHKDTSEVTIYKCDLCTYTTKHKPCLKNHGLTHKDPSEVILYKCEQCTYETKFKPNIKRHMKNHNEMLQYKCDGCTFKTNYKSSLKVHMLIHKNPSELTMYKCEQCTYKTKRKSDLNCHALTHEGPSEGQSYKCENCTYETKSKRYFKQHMKNHKDLPAVV